MDEYIIKKETKVTHAKVKIRNNSTSEHAVTMNIGLLINVYELNL